MKKEEKKHAEQAGTKPPVYGNESFGIPSDCSKKQKFSSLKLAFYIVVVVSVCGLLYSGFHRATDALLPEMTFDKSQEALLYLRNHDVAVKDYNDRRGRGIVSSEQLYSGGDSKYVTITDNEKYLFFAQDNSGTESGFDLCYRKISEAPGKKGEPAGETVRIASDVRRYEPHPNGNFVLYLKGNRLYFSNLKKSKMLALDVKDFYLSKNNQQAIYYKTDGSVYTCVTSMKGAPVLVDTDITKVLSEKQEYAKIYYIKNNALYLKEYGEERELIAEDVADAILLDSFLYFVRKEPWEWRFTDIFVDDMQDLDKQAKEPALSDYYKEDEEGHHYLDETSYHEALAEYEQKVVRDTVRAYLEGNPITTEQFVLYSAQSGNVRAIDNHLAEYTLRQNSDKQVLLYKRNVLQEEKILFSTVTGIEDALSRGTDFVSSPASVGMGVLAKDKTPYLGLTEFPQSAVEISPDGKWLYTIENADESGTGTLVRYDIAARALKNRRELCKNAQEFFVDSADPRVVIVFEGKKMGIVVEDAYTHLSDTSTQDFFYVDGTLYFFDAYDEQAESGKLKRFRDGKVKQVDTYVHSFDVRNLKTVAYIKNYNVEYGFGDLYIKTGNKKREKIDICVRSIVP